MTYISDKYDPEPEDQPTHAEYCDDDDCPCRTEVDDEVDR